MFNERLRATNYILELADLNHATKYSLSNIREKALSILENFNFKFASDQ